MKLVYLHANVRGYLDNTVLRCYTNTIGSVVSFAVAVKSAVSSLRIPGQTIVSIRSVDVSSFFCSVFT